MRSRAIVVMTAVFHDGSGVLWPRMQLDSITNAGTYKAWRVARAWRRQ